MLKKMISAGSRLNALYCSDARHYQISFLSIFLLAGLFRLHWPLSYAQIFITLTATLSTQYIALRLLRLPMDGLKSALITSLSLCLLFRSDHLVVVALAGILSITSKYLLRQGGKHFFNPANFGICASILLTGKAWISPGQWGSEGLWLMVVGVLGMLVVTRAKRSDLALSFLLAFGGCMFIRMYCWQEWPADALLHVFSNGALLLFTFFMITDPVSTPQHPIARKLWALAAGCLAFYLQAYQWVNGAPLWALFMLSFITPLVDHFIKARKYAWTNKTNTLNENTKNIQIA